MKRVNETLFRSITDSLEAIKNNTFDQKTIKLLLIDLREIALPNSGLREICHFVAHSERDDGLFYKSIISRYERFKYSIEFMNKLDFKKAKPGMTFDELVVQQIDYHFYESIPKKYFKIVFQYGLDDFDENFYDKYVKKTKLEVQQIITNAYKKVNGFYVLRDKSNIEFIQLMSFFHTSIQFRAILSEEQFTEQLINTVALVFSGKDIYKKYINMYSNEVFVCIMCILHDVNFINDNTIIGNSFLTTNHSLLNLCCTSKIDSKELTFCLLSSNSRIGDYLDHENKCTDDKRLSVFSVIRNEYGNLRLV